MVAAPRVIPVGITEIAALFVVGITGIVALFVVGIAEVVAPTAYTGGQKFRSSRASFLGEGIVVTGNTHKG